MCRRAWRVRQLCPTITPGAKILIGDLGRVMLPIEKCLAHLVPVHRLSWPASFTDATFADLGGNAMHLMTAQPLATSNRAHALHTQDGPDFNSRRVGQAGRQGRLVHKHRYARAL